MAKNISPEKTEIQLWHHAGGHNLIELTGSRGVVLEVKGENVNHGCTTHLGSSGAMAYDCESLKPVALYLP